MAFVANLLGVTSSQAAERKLELSPCRVKGVDREVRCGVFHVPENRTRPNGRMLPLKVIVLPARSGKLAREPIFYFEGGPGEAATESADYVAGSWQSQDHDVVLVDQRGTGEGHRLDCKLPGSDEDVQGYVRQPYDALAACAAKLAPTADLTQYVSPIAARDADELRAALGYGRVNLSGGSYGSRMVMIYARMYPHRVRAAYVSGPAPLSQRLPLYFAQSSQGAFDATLAECAADPACAAKYPDPKADLAAVRARLRQTPVMVEITPPAGGRPVSIEVDDWAFSNALFYRLYRSEKPDVLPGLIHRARQGDFRELIEGFAGAMRSNRGPGMHWGMHRAVLCSEDVARVKPDEVEPLTAGTLLGPVLMTRYIEGCKAWPRAELPADYHEDFQVQTPMLITSGEFDPVTPPRWGEETRRSFPNSLHVASAQGHQGFSEDGCLGKIIAQFMAQASVTGLDLTCVKAPENRLRIVSGPPPA